MVIFLFLSIDLAAQVSEGGVPYSYAMGSAAVSYKILDLDPPDMVPVLEQDQLSLSETVPYRMISICLLMVPGLKPERAGVS